MPIATYDSKAIVATVGGQVVTGGVDGDFLTIEYDEDHVSLTVGANGESARSLIRNYAAKLTFRLMASSPTNHHFSSIYAADRATGGGVTNIGVQDNNGADKHGAAAAWIVKPPSVAYSREVGEREWVFQTNELINFIGGYTNLPAPYAAP